MKLWDAVLELLYPSRCAFCRSFTSNAEKVCADCLRSLPYTRGPGQEKALRFIKKAVSPLYYEGSVRESLLRYKFGGLTGYAQIYGDFMAKCIDENEISCDIITWVPLSRRRLRRRGYDQARLLAEELAARRSVPCVALLRKTRDNPAQSGAGSPEKRRANVQGVYAPVNEEFMRGRSVLLVDDILTTGATLTECAGVLQAAGAASVSAAAAAVTR